MSLIYKICEADIWRDAETAGKFCGAGIDLVDGYIHFSTAAQASDTARLHFKHTENLVLVAVDTATLEIKWEASRGGDLFPHLYGDLPMSAVIAVEPMQPDQDGVPTPMNGFPKNITDI